MDDTEKVEYLVLLLSLFAMKMEILRSKSVACRRLRISDDECRNCDGRMRTNDSSKSVVSTGPMIQG